MGASDSRLASFYYGSGRAGEGGGGGGHDGGEGPSSPPMSPTGRRNGGGGVGGPGPGPKSPVRRARSERGTLTSPITNNKAAGAALPQRQSTLNSLGRLLGLGKGGYFSRGGGGGGGGFHARRSHESYLSQPSSLHERILAFQYEGVLLDEAATTDNDAAWAEDEGYMDSLQDAADALDSAYNDVNPDSVLLVNISPQLLRRPELYALFGGEPYKCIHHCPPSTQHVFLFYFFFISFAHVFALIDSHRRV